MNEDLSTPQETQNSFLIYEIVCKDTVKGYIVGTEHFVHPEDVDLNKAFQEVIGKTTTAYLEVIPHGDDTLTHKTLLDHIVKDYSGKGNIPYDYQKVSESLLSHEALLKKIIDAGQIPGLTWQALQERLAHLNPVEKLASYNDILKLHDKVMDRAFDEHIYDKLKNSQINIRPLENPELIEQHQSNVSHVVMNVLKEMCTQPPKVTESDMAKYTAKPREAQYYHWKSGNEKDFAAHLHQKPHPEHYELLLHQKRNEGIAQRIDEVVTNMPYEKPLFMCSASHLFDKRIGKTVFDWLHERGFELRQIK